MVDCHFSNITKLKKNISSSSSHNHKDYNLVLLGGFGPKVPTRLISDSCILCWGNNVFPIHDLTKLMII